MIYFPPFLGGAILQPGIVMRGVLPLLSFCMASSAGYILNDIQDCDNDRHHPDKKKRPLPSGRISTGVAYLFAVVLAFAAAATAWTVSSTFFLYLVAYLLLTLTYSVWFKEVALIDIFCIAAGFLLRLQAGGSAFAIHITEWLFLSVFLLSIFLSTGKRLSDKNRLGASAGNHRKTLTSYPLSFLQGTMYMTGSSVLVMYTMYVITRHSVLLLYTVPLCCFGLLHYILRIQSGKDGDPTESLTRDIPLLLVSMLWVIMVGWGIYGK